MNILISKYPIEIQIIPIIQKKNLFVLVLPVSINYFLKIPLQNPISQFLNFIYQSNNFKWVKAKMLRFTQLNTELSIFPKVKFSSTYKYEGKVTSFLHSNFTKIFPYIYPNLIRYFTHILSRFLYGIALHPF